jgi:ferredoxin
MRPLRIPGLCTGCGTCVEYCKQHAIALKNGISVLDEQKCVLCGICVHSCPYHLLKSGYALPDHGRGPGRVSADETMRQGLQDRPLTIGKNRPNANTREAIISAIERSLGRDRSS